MKDPVIGEELYSCDIKPSIHRTIKEYSLAEADGEQYLVTLVNEMIGTGWQPLGGINHAMAYDQGGHFSCWYSQALVKYEE